MRSWRVQPIASLDNPTHGPYQIIDSASTATGKSIDHSGTCKSALETLNKTMKQVPDHIDNMDEMLFKPRDQLALHDVKAELNAVVPGFEKVVDLNNEIEGLVKTKNKCLAKLDR